MNAQEVAKAFTDLCRAGKFEAAGERFWADDVASLEPMAGDMAHLHGRREVEAKGKSWAENNQVHTTKVEGPYVNGDQFILRFDLEVTPKGKSRTRMTETGLYTVRGGKIVEERFFAGN